MYAVTRPTVLLQISLSVSTCRMSDKDKKLVRDVPPSQGLLQSAKSQTEEAPQRAKRLSPISRLCLIFYKYSPLQFLLSSYRGHWQHWVPGIWSECFVAGRRQGEHATSYAKEKEKDKLELLLCQEVSVETSFPRDLFITKISKDRKEQKLNLQHSGLVSYLVTWQYT